MCNVVAGRGQRWLRSSPRVICIVQSLCRSISGRHSRGGCTTGRCITARPVRSRFAVSRYADPWLLSSYVGSSGVAVDVSSIGCRLVRSVMCKEGGGVVHSRL